MTVNALYMEAMRRRSEGQTTRYIARVLCMDRQEVRLLTRPLNRGGRLYSRHSKPGKA